jgi:uncharacterized membrane protein YcaP (DUF421 family)
MDLLDTWESAIGAGLEPKDLEAWQTALRAAIVYVVTLAFIRMGKKRFLGSASAFDVVVGIIIGSIASRAITGNAPLLSSMSAAAMIIALHWLFSGIAVRSHAFGNLVKGHSHLLVENGQVDHEALRASHMTDRDLAEALREKGVGDVAKIACARLERDGSVSVIQR